MTLRRSFVRWLAAAGTVPLLAVGLAHTSVAATTYTPFNSPVGGLEGSEILDITPNGDYAVMVGANNITETKLRIVTVDPASGFTKSSLALDPAVAGLGLQRPVASSVAMHPTAGYAIVTIKECVENCTPPSTISSGGAVFVTVGSNGALSLARPSALALGLQPESIDIAPNGSYAVVANEGRLGSGGTISVIDLSNGPVGATTQVFTPAIANPQPEAVAISPDSARAFVTLQANNAVAVIDINPTTLAPTHSVVSLGNDPTRNVALNPDGIAVTPDGGYIVTANEGISGTTRANSVSMFRVNPDRTLTRVDSETISAGDERPEMVAIGQVGGQIRAFVSLEATDKVAVFTVTTTGTPALTPETQVALGTNGDAPEGIAIVHGRDLVVTANQGSRNISVIQAANTPPPTTLKNRVYLPMAQKGQ